VKLPKGKYCLITNDVETTSILNHRLDDNVAEYVYRQGMPRLLDLYEKYNVKATFFFTAHIAKLIPDVIRMILPYGHEVASHGYTHDVKQAFDILSYKKQVEHLRLSKEIIEDIAGVEISSFRAPAARVDRMIVSALLEVGFKVDSSVSSQRIDMFMSFGSLKKLNWLISPRLPYFTATDNVFRRGSGSLLEIPISALGFPYIGTFMRIAPKLNRVTRNLLHLESRMNNRPFVFLTHPNEFIDEIKSTQIINRRSNSFFSYIFGDLLRHKLKTKNLGEIALPIYEKELMFFKQNEYEFLRMNDYLKLLKTTKN
jgi:peptidoglycan/xylan/chitin deacetylase (PgdA/CDA1 family)